MGLDENLLRAKLTYILNLTIMDQDLKNEFDRIDQRFDTLIEFLRQNFPTKAELTEELETLRSDIATKAELRLLTNSIDAYAKIAKDYFQEVTVLGAPVSRMKLGLSQQQPNSALNTNLNLSEALRRARAGVTSPAFLLAARKNVHGS